MGILSDIQNAFDAVANDKAYTGGDSPARYAGGVAGSLYKNFVQEPINSFGLLSDSVDKAQAGQPINLTEDIQQPLMDWGMVAAPVGLMSMPSNSLGIFAGKMAKTADREALSRAEGMLAQGADMPTIWKETGWGMAPDGAWRFEIPDNAMAKAAPEWMDEIGGKADGYFSHPDLFAAYPDVGNVRVGLMDGTGGYFDSELWRSGIGRDGNVTSTGAHELQHVVQSLEGFARGGSPDEFMRGQALSDSAYDAYRRLHGEAEARSVQDRLHMAPEERRNVLPEYFTQTDLIVRR
jgi:hypothetical protein